MKMPMAAWLLKASQGCHGYAHLTLETSVSALLTSYELWVASYTGAGLMLSMPEYESLAQSPMPQSK